MSLKNKQVQLWARRIHIYVSMALLIVTLFFSVTGITLNRPELFESSRPNISYKALLIPEQVLFEQPGLFRPDKEELIGYLRERADLGGFASSIDTYTELDNGALIQGELSLDFKGPGYNATVFIDMVTREAEIEITDYGVVALLNDLHKGRNSGDIWKWFIDITALLMVVFVVTGLCLLLPKKKTLIVALRWCLFGTLTTWAVYVLAVP